jgi:uncharacterized protein YbaA (DUF1428 family)
MSYVDGFVIAVPSGNRDKFVDHAMKFDEMLIAEGALRVVECWGSDVKHGKQTDFFGAVKATDGETVCFSWVEWPDKATRDAVHARMQEKMTSGEIDGSHADMPFDGARMIFGGFEPVVDIGPNSGDGA